MEVVSGEQLVRFVTHDGLLHEFCYYIRWVYAGPTGYLSAEGLPEALFNGLKKARLGQFNQVDRREFVLIAPAKYRGYWRDFFMKKCNKRNYRFKGESRVRANVGAVNPGNGV